MFRFCSKMKKKKTKVLLYDLHGKTYKFYRGKDTRNIQDGIYFCSSFDIARSYSMHNIVFEAEISTSSPLVIDATIKNGYSYYESIYIKKCPMYPENKRKKLIAYLDEVSAQETLSTDEILRWAMKEKDIDAVIIKNVREGINYELPIYDVMIWNKVNLVNLKEVTNQHTDYAAFRANTFKRVDLSNYIMEKEEDGIVNTLHFENYDFIDAICNGKDNKWGMNHKLIIRTQASIVHVKNCDTNEIVTGLLISSGIYSNAETFGNKDFIPNDGIVVIKGMHAIMKRYEIEEIL